MTVPESGGRPSSRTVFVEHTRIERWVAGFAERHAPARAVLRPDAVELLGEDGARAVLHPVLGPLLLPPSTPTEAPPLHSDPLDASSGPDLFTGFPPHHGVEPVSRPEARRPSDMTLAPAFPPVAPSPAAVVTPGEAAALLVTDARSAGVLRALLVRRGGYACAVVDGDRVTASKVGSRHVQGRTAAGGWSQQRFARRRNGQVHVLLGAVTDVAARLLLPGLAPTDVLVTGGDRPLLERVLSDPRLSPLAVLRRAPHLQIGDPGSPLVQDLPTRARSIRITLP